MKEDCRKLVDGLDDLAKAIQQFKKDWEKLIKDYPETFSEIFSLLKVDITAKIDEMVAEMKGYVTFCSNILCK